MSLDQYDVFSTVPDRSVRDGTEVKVIESIHGNYVFGRRTRVLGDHLAELIPKDSSVLDVGCGDGLLASLITQKRPDVTLRGIEVLVRSQTYIPVDEFDGRVMPFADNSFDVVMFVDTLHHTHDPMILLREAVRLARRAILIKDHTLNGLFSGPRLRFMDRVGNARYRVALPYNYWPQRRWLETFETLGLKVNVWVAKLELYPWPATWFFDGSLHFIARLDLN